MACAINLGSSVIITGGVNFTTTVTEYNEDGWVSDLPDLHQGRWDHGCSYYNNDDGTKVNKIWILIKYYNHISDIPRIRWQKQKY